MMLLLYLIERQLDFRCITYSVEDLRCLQLIVQVSMGYGTVTAYALMSLEARGTLFVNPGLEVCTAYDQFFASRCWLLHIQATVRHVNGWV